MNRQVLATIAVILGLLGALYYIYEMVTGPAPWHDHVYMVALFALISVFSYPNACYGSFNEVHSVYLLDRAWREAAAGYIVIGVLLVVSLILHCTQSLDYLRQELGSLIVLAAFAGSTYYRYRKQRKRLR
ncbi:hypothetical protein [uncultured Porphyromonas sp.]|uniref:hypothetical protein n=1 Tax=uncultured Porphyromonas sp. TaxID=159274 RepID=UPI0026199917|nr:hypothetical protein [uncultured Porphyromonas sp.]